MNVVVLRYYFCDAADDRFKKLESQLYLNRAWSVSWREGHHAMRLFIRLFYNLYYYYYEGWNFNSGNYLFTTDTK